jgi:hypothetical protein
MNKTNWKPGDVVFTTAAILLIIITFLIITIGSSIEFGQSVIVSDCDKFNAFEVEDVIYECKRR